MDQKKNSGCMTILIVLVPLTLIGLVCSHVEKEVAKMDGFTNTVLGVTFIGLLVLCYYFYDRSK